MNICTHENESLCEVCQIKGDLMCRFRQSDLWNFLLNFTPFGIVVIAGMVRAGFGWHLFGLLGYMLFFFFVWEARALCSHCPYWAEEGRILHCHANSGVFKIWKFNPKPMSRSEQFQFVIGALVMIAYPLPFMLIGGQYLFAFITLAAAVAFTYNLIHTTCTRCINFSCPLNGVPKPTVDSYLRRNPIMRAAWEESGYQLGKEKRTAA